MRSRSVGFLGLMILIPFGASADFVTCTTAGKPHAVKSNRGTTYWVECSGKPAKKGYFDDAVVVQSYLVEVTEHPTEGKKTTRTIEIPNSGKDALIQFKVQVQKLARDQILQAAGGVQKYFETHSAFPDFNPKAFKVDEACFKIAETERGSCLSSKPRQYKDPNLGPGPDMNIGSSGDDVDDPEEDSASVPR